MSLRSSRRAYLDNFDVSGIIDDYLEWLKHIFYVVVWRFNYLGKPEYACFRSAKRGDELYASRVMSKFAILGKHLEDRWFYNRKVRSGWVESHALLITLEYDSNKYSLKESWALAGIDFNRYMSFLRRAYGKCSIIRCFEAHESGYVHIHLVVLFFIKSFKGKPMKDKKGRRVFRVVGDDWHHLKAGWVHGFSDVRMVDSVKGGSYYLSKYLSKSVSVKEAGDKGLKALSMCWFMRKRSFSVSGDFIPLYSDVINSNSNSNKDGLLIEVGKDLLGHSIFLRATKWRFFGFLIADRVLFASNFSFVDGSSLVCVDENRNLYGLLEKHRVSLDDGLNRKLIVF